MAPSTYYAAKARPASSRATRDAVLRPVIRELWEDNYRVYGARKLWKAAKRAGYDIGRDQVSRLMRAEGLRAQVGYHRRAVTGEARSVGAGRLVDLASARPLP